MHDKYLEFHDHLLLLNRRRRLTALRRGVPSDEAGLGLSYVDESVLHLLLAGERNVKELAAAVSLERSWMSRVVQGLERKELLRAVADPSDGRSKRLQVTAKGQKILKDLDELLTEIMDETLKPISSEERKRLVELMRELADSLNAPKGEGRTSVHPVHLQAARLSRAMGVFGSNLLGAGITITQFHVFYELTKRGKEGAVMTELDTVLPFDASTLSRTLAEFDRQSWLDRAEDENDRRAQVVSLSAKGREIYRRYQKKASDKMTAAMSDFSASQVNQFIEILKKVTERLPTVSSRGVRPTEARELTRAEFTEALSEWRSSMKPVESAKLVGLFAGNDLIAAAHLARKGEREPYQLSIFGVELVPEELVVLLRGLGE